MISIQTNVDSMLAQENLRVNSNFQTQTIERLTSGYRINSSGDDAAGLAVANQFRSQIAELTQGVSNANDGIAQLQIIDGGLNNISTMLDRLNTLATQSASQTFTGDRTTLNNEYQSLLGEINRQADNVGLGADNAVNARSIGVYIGGGQDANTNSTVNVNLTGSNVDTASLGLNNTNILTNGAVSIGTVKAALINPTDTATFNIQTGAGVSTITITGNSGDTLQGQINELNAQMQSLGITASQNNAGVLQFTSANAFSVQAYAGTAANLVDVGTSGAAGDFQNNAGLYSTTYSGAGTTMNIVVGNTTATATVSGTNDAADVAAINTALKNAGITDVSAVLNETAAGPAGISFQGATKFSYYDNILGSGAAVTAGNPTAVAGNPNTAINAIAAALKSLGTTQGNVGAGENDLNYAINLAQSQITNFSSAESQIRDADIASEAANLTKAQVLQQSSIAAMAQANSAPQAILKLLQ